MNTGKHIRKKRPLPVQPPLERWIGSRDYPSGLFNAMIAPLIPYGIRGAIWYQGESNAYRAYQYRTLFPALIEDWRNAWGQGDFPFLFVQLANFKAFSGSWPELREAQVMALKVPDTAMVVTIDIGEPDDIHPNNKWDVGERLALGALNIVYDRKIVYSGPMYRSMQRENGAVRLKFDHIANGLVSRKGEILTGFVIAGADRIFHEASARIDGADVIVSSPDVPDPVAVRYGWEDCPECNLYNSAGLPASPFRTDNWTGITEHNLKP